MNALKKKKKEKEKEQEKEKRRKGRGEEGEGDGEEEGEGEGGRRTRKRRRRYLFDSKHDNHDNSTPGSSNKARLPVNPKINNAGHPQNIKAANRYKKTKKTSMQQ